MYDRKAFATAVKRYRKDHGLTADAFAERVGISSPYLSDIEKERSTPKLLIIITIINELGISYTDIMQKDTSFTEMENYILAKTSILDEKGIGLLIRIAQALEMG